jgi:uncharacterized Ntn-hydrolase superfamily protein
MSSTTNDTAKPCRPVHTYSIVARDPATGQLGVAVQSHWFSVGSIVTWAEAGVGAVATQSFAEPAYGPRGLALMKAGKTPKQALDELVAGDEGEAVRQVAFVDATGAVAAHTGSGCIQSAGHQLGEGYSVQANMMLDDDVVPAMAAGYEAAEGDLAERLMVALEAAQAAGGDIRGRQSAALLVVGPTRVPEWQGRIVELRIEDHATPIKELRRLLTVHRAYEHMNAADVALEAGDMKAGLGHYEAAAALQPDNIEVVYWHAIALAINDRFDESESLFRRVFDQDANWVELTRRLHTPGIIEDSPAGRALVKKITALAKKR